MTPARHHSAPSTQTCPQSHLRVRLAATTIRVNRIPGRAARDGKAKPLPPTKANGKLCYVEIPAIDVPRSAGFYEAVFGWRIRRRGDGRTAFDDTVGEVSGAWVTGRPPSWEPGLLLYIMVDSAAAAVEAVIAHGGEIVQPIGLDAPEVTARFRDPAGNVVGLHQEPSEDSPPLA